MYNIILIIGIVGSGDLSLYRTCRQFSFFLFQLFIGFHINKNHTVLYSITLLQYDTILFVDIPASLVAGPTHLEAQSMAPNQTFPADDGAGVAGQVP